MILIKGRREGEARHASEGVRDKDGPNGTTVSMDTAYHLWAWTKPLVPTSACHARCATSGVPSPLRHLTITASIAFARVLQDFLGMDQYNSLLFIARIEPVSTVPKFIFESLNSLSVLSSLCQSWCCFKA